MVASERPMNISMTGAEAASCVGVNSSRAPKGGSGGWRGGGKTAAAARSSPGHSCIINRRSTVSTRLQGKHQSAHSLFLFYFLFFYFSFLCCASGCHVCNLVGGLMKVHKPSLVAFCFFFLVPIKRRQATTLNTHSIWNKFYYLTIKTHTEDRVYRAKACTC